MHVTNKTYFETVRFIDSHEQETDLVAALDKALEVKVEFEPFDELLIKRLHNNAINSPRAVRYYEGRRISMESMVKFQLGYSENYDMVTTPVHSPDGSMYLGFVGRSVEGKEFKNTSGNWRSKTLFNLHRARVHSTVYVVESNFDAIRLDQNGVPAVATLGAYVSKNQVNLLTKHFNSVIVVADNDNGGNKMSEKMVERLGNRVTIVGIPQRFKDVGDMTDADIQELTKRTNDPLLAMY
jgi:DNA primase